MTKTLLECNIESFAYATAEEPTLRNLQLQVVAGDIIGIAGGCGTGKTTLALILAGYQRQFLEGNMKGKLGYPEQGPEELPYEKLLRTVGYANAEPFLQLTGCCETVEEELCWSLLQLGASEEEALSQVSPVMEQLDLMELKDRSVYALSGGQLQRVAFCSILVLQPQILILDEVVSQLDPSLQSRIGALVEDYVSKDKAVVWLTTRVDECRLCNKRFILQEGHLEPFQVVGPNIGGDVLNGALPPNWWRHYEKLEGTQFPHFTGEEEFWDYVATHR